MVDNKSQNLEGLVREFETLDSKLFEKFNENIIREILQSKRSIKKYIFENKPSVLGEPLIGKVKKIRDNYGYNIDIFCNDLAPRIIGQKISQEYNENIDFIDALFSEGTANYVDENFFKRRLEIGSLVLRREGIPDIMIHHLAKLKECYSLGLFAASIIYSRAIIETGVFIYFKRKRWLPQDAVKLDKKLSIALDEVKRHYQKSKGKHFVNYELLFIKAFEAKKSADVILHETSSIDNINESEHNALDSIKTTFAFIEELLS